MEGFCCCQKTIVFWSQWILRNEKSAIGLATHPLEKRPFIIASAFLEYLVVASEKACASHSLTKLHSLLSRVGWELVLLKDQHDDHDGTWRGQMHNISCLHNIFQGRYTRVHIGLCGSLWSVARFYHFPNDWSSDVLDAISWSNSGMDPSSPSHLLVTSLTIFGRVLLAQQGQLRWKAMQLGCSNPWSPYCFTLQIYGFDPATLNQQKSQSTSNALCNEASEKQ